MPHSSRKTIFTTISIDKETAALVEKICKRYSLKKSEVVKLAFGYIDKAHINPSEAPESVKSELAKINKRQDDIIRFIRHYEEEQINALYQIHQRDYKKLLHLIQLYSELSACGVMDSKRKENLKTEISNLINT